MGALIAGLIATVLAARQEKPAVDELWELSATAPGTDSRNNVWHTGLNVPPFEEARVVPVGVLMARLWVDVAGGDFREDKQGGPSLWQNLVIEELLQVDYGLLPDFQAGIRLSTGSVIDQRNRDVQVFQDDELITKDLDRHFGLDSLVLRGKYANHWQDQFQWALLAEMKIPLADQGNPIATHTLDFSLTLMATRCLGADVWIHASAGAVLPIGDTGWFVKDDDPNVFYTYALGVTWRAASWISVFAQAEGNTSAFEQYDDLDSAVLTWSVGARARVMRGVSIDVIAGRGVNESSADLFAAVGVNVAYSLR